MEGLKFIEEEKCKCGWGILLGYGYYKHGKEIRCQNCGRWNKK